MKGLFFFNFETKEQINKVLSIVDPNYKDDFEEPLSLKELTVEQLNFFLVLYIRHRNYDLYMRLHESFQRNGEELPGHYYGTYLNLSFKQLYSKGKIGNDIFYNLKGDIVTPSNYKAVLRSVESYINIKVPGIYFLFLKEEKGVEILEEKAKLYSQISGEGVW